MPIPVSFFAMRSLAVTELMETGDAGSVCCKLSHFLVS